MFPWINKISHREQASLTIILQSYKYLLEDDDILAKLDLDETQKEILFESIDETINKTIPKLSE